MCLLRELRETAKQFMSARARAQTDTCRFMLIALICGTGSESVGCR